MALVPTTGVEMTTSAKRVEETHAEPRMTIHVIRYSGSNRITFVCDRFIDIMLDTPVAFTCSSFGAARPLSHVSMSPAVTILATRLFTIEGLVRNRDGFPSIGRNEVNIYASMARYGSDIERDVIGRLADFFSIAVDDITVAIHQSTTRSTS